MKRLIYSVLAVGIVTVVVFSVTSSFFSDTETSTGNSFTAGSLDLKVDSQCTYNGQPSTECGTWELSDLNTLTSSKFFNFSDVKPGDVGENTISLHVFDNPAWLCAYVDNLTNNDNGLNGPESLVDITDGAGNGELQDHLYVTIWRDADCENDLDVEIPETAGYCQDTLGFPQCLDANGSANPESDCLMWQSYGDGCIWHAAQPGVPGDEVLVDNALVDTHNGVWPLYTPALGGGPLAGDTTTCLGLAWNVPSEVGNVIQSDSVTGDISFYVEQARNNSQFVCPTSVQPVP